MVEQSNLERLGIDERKRELVKAEYNTENQYSAQHPDALTPYTPNATGEEKGKGTGAAVSHLTLPSVKTSNHANPGPNGITVQTETGGSVADIEKRKEGFIRNLYSPDNRYEGVDETQNIKDGQVVINW